MRIQTVVCVLKRAGLYAAVTAIAGAGVIAAAQDVGRDITVKIPVSLAGLDLDSPAGAHEAYMRLHWAARTACGSGNRVGLQPVVSFAACYEQSLAEGVRAINRAQLTLQYLDTHTLQQASQYGIKVPSLVAGK